MYGTTLSKKPFRPLYIFKHVLKSNFVLFIWKNIAGYPTKVLLADVELLQYDMVIGFYRVVLITWWHRWSSEVIAARYLAFSSFRIKHQIGNFVHMGCFWNNLQQGRSNAKDWKTKYFNLKVFKSKETPVLKIIILSRNCKYQ